MGSQRLPGAVPRRNMHWGLASADAQAQPEDILIAWLLWLPRNADVAKAAADEVARIDNWPSLPSGAVRLRELLLQLIDGAGLPKYGRA